MQFLIVLLVIFLGIIIHLVRKVRAFKYWDDKDLPKECELHYLKHKEQELSKDYKSLLKKYNELYSLSLLNKQNL